MSVDVRIALISIMDQYLAYAKVPQWIYVFGNQPYNNNIYSLMKSKTVGFDGFLVTKTIQPFALRGTDSNFNDFQRSNLTLYINKKINDLRSNHKLMQKTTRKVVNSHPASYLDSKSLAHPMVKISEKIISRNPCHYQIRMTTMFNVSGSRKSRLRLYLHSKKWLSFLMRNLIKKISPHNYTRSINLLT